MVAKQLTDGNTTDAGYDFGQSPKEKIGFHGKAPTVQAAAMTAPLTTITFAAPGTPDYAIQAPINASAWGFASADEARTFIAVVANQQTRINELEAIVTGKGLAETA